MSKHWQVWAWLSGNLCDWLTFSNTLQRCSVLESSDLGSVPLQDTGRMATYHRSFGGKALPFANPSSCAIRAQSWTRHGSANKLWCFLPAVKVCARSRHCSDAIFPATRHSFNALFLTECADGVRSLTAKVRLTRSIQALHSAT